MTPLRSLSLLVGAFAVQILEPLFSGFVPYGYALALAVSATLAVQFVLRNALAPGVALVGLGLALNAWVVLINGEVPVSVAAAERAGVPESALELASDPRHEPTGPSTRLGFLGDVLPAPIPGAREVVSIGDVLLAAGVGLFAFTAVTRPSQPRSRAGSVSAAPGPAGT